MKSLLMKLGFVWIMLSSMLPSVFSQGVLTIEISDTLNIPLSGISVRITDANGTVKTYKTDSEGRVRDDNFPVGEFSYNFYYGDYNTGKFSVTSGNYTWVDIDFRRVVVNFKDEAGKPQSGNFVTMYKREDDGTRTLVGQKNSGEDGKVLFVLPKGNYTYVAADGSHDIVVDDQNINTSVGVSSTLVTYKTSFRFIKGGKPISVFARDVNVSQNKNGSFRDFGIVLAHGDSQSNGYVEYEMTDGKISCPVGEYKYSVYTRDYGTLQGTFFVTQNNSETNNVVDIIIPEQEVEEQQPIITPDEEKPTFLLKVHVVDCDSLTPISNLATRYSVPGTGSSNFATTNANGIATFKVNEGTYNVSIPTETKENIVVNKDTTIEFCTYPLEEDTTSQKIYFQFFYNDEEVFPQTINKIDIRKIESGHYLSYVSLTPTEDSILKIKNFTEPAVTITGDYYYSFQLDEYDITYYSGNFTTLSTKTTDTIKIVFEKKYKVDIYVLHQDSTPATASYNVSYIDNYKNNRRTDNTGHIQLVLPAREYSVIALDKTVSFDLKKDTSLYFFLPDPEHSRNVFFKFLHDGKVIYPNVTTLTFYRNKSTQQYAYLSSTLYEDFEDIGRAYVFDKSIELPADTFTANYYIDDYEFDGQMNHDFYVNPISQSDTTIYIVVPVKRTVEIQIKDAKNANVQGVFAKIYKYDEDGELSSYLDYDGNSHSKLMSDATGIVRDHLVPGRYQIQILNIVRDFEVSDYDLRFTILSDVEMFNVKFTVLYSDDHQPVSNLKFDIKKGNEFYNSGITSEEGIFKFQSEAGNYSYTLYYGNGISESYKISKDEEFTIYVDRPVLVKTIALVGGEECLKPGESTKFIAIINPENATQKNIEWSIDNNVIAKVSSDGTLTANTIGLSGVVNLTAKAKDESGVSATVTVNIGEEECIKSYTLAFGDGTTEMWLDDYAFDLVVTPSVNKYQYYAYQTSTDGVNWTLAFETTPETTITVDAQKYMHNGTYLFRAIAAEDALELLNILDGTKDIDPDNITNVIFLHYDKKEGEAIKDKIEIPTVFTPHEKNGANDDFMPGYPVVIYNRFGDVISKSDNGWNGKYKGEIADAGVYIYVLTLRDGTEKRGTIQLYRK